MLPNPVIQYPCQIPAQEPLFFYDFPFSSSLERVPAPVLVVVLWNVVQHHWNQHDLAVLMIYLTETLNDKLTTATA
jgi:hypothetical protein